MTDWRKSTFSGSNSDCVEVVWRKSTFSGGNSDCVEVAPGADRVRVRDSKNATGPILVIPPRSWTRFLESRT